MGWEGVRGQGGRRGVTPSTPHLLLLDLLLALVQLTTLVVAFGATVPSDLEASSAAAAGGAGAGAAGEAAREYGGLLGEEEEEEEEEEEQEERDIEEEGDERRAPPGRRRRRKGGYVGLDALNDEEDDDDDEVEHVEGASLDPTKSFPSSSSSPPFVRPEPSHIPLPPLASLRLRVLWRELLTSAAASARAREDRGVLEGEEGRVGGSGRGRGRGRGRTRAEEV
ncbi:hypothetical protein JCM6882_001220 [Rhodosporidiobolus microsporus]